MSELREVTYKCIDIGYGVEEGRVLGSWSTEVDPSGAGKRLLLVSSPWADPELWLFPDEVVSDIAVKP